MKRYYVKYGHDTDDFADEYEVLFRPDETIVASITEPEDRNFYRDLAPVVAELNKLEDVAQFLFGLLDDIDSVDDIAGPDNGLYRELVRKLHPRRFAVADTDGYTVSWKSNGRQESEDEK